MYNAGASSAGICQVAETGGSRGGAAGRGERLHRRPVYMDAILTLTQLRKVGENKKKNGVWDGWAQAR